MDNEMSSLTQPHKRLMSLTVAIVATAALFGQSRSAASVIPPGNAAADQYTEGYWGAGGNEQGSLETSPNHQPSFSKKEIKDFGSRGQIGQSTLSVAASTSPQVAVGWRDRSRRDKDRKDSERESPARSGSSDANANLEIATQALGMSGNGGIGYGLPVIILAATLLAIGFSISRNRASR